MPHSGRTLTTGCLARRRYIAILAALLLLAQAVAPVSAAEATPYPYAFRLGFATLASLLLTDNIALAPTDNEAHNPQNGDALQHAVSIKDGKQLLLVWRKADNWTAATDGYFTWVNGPNGLQKRLNTERFSFEANLDKLPTAASIPLAAGPNAGISAATYATLLAQYEQAHPVVPRHAYWEVSPAPTAPPPGGQPTPPGDRNFRPDIRAELMPVWLKVDRWFDDTTPNVVGSAGWNGQLQDYAIVNGNVVLSLSLDSSNPKRITTITLAPAPGEVSARVGFFWPDTYAPPQGGYLQRTPFFVTDDPVMVVEGINYYSGGIGSVFNFGPTNPPHVAPNTGNGVRWQGRLDYLIGFTE